MQTKLTDNPSQTAEIIRLGGIVAFPTETVYGLGADVFNPQAIKKIFQAKQRPADNPLIAHVGKIEDIAKLTTNLTDSAQKFIEAFFPGPLTIVVSKNEKVPPIATAKLDTIGVRMPNHKLALEFLRACGTPVVAPSANLSGKPSPTTWQAVYEDLNGKIDCILQGEPTEIGLESTVVDCTAEIPLILRTGAITLEQLQKIEPRTQIYQIKEGEVVKSPGLKHRHYSPKAKVMIVSDFEFHIADSCAFIGLQKPDIEFDLEKICSTVEEYAYSFFHFFRECDRKNIKTIYCQTVEEKGIGVALMDRLRRAENP